MPQSNALLPVCTMPYYDQRRCCGCTYQERFLIFQQRSGQRRAIRAGQAALAQEAFLGSWQLLAPASQALQQDLCDNTYKLGLKLCQIILPYVHTLHALSTRAQRQNACRSSYGLSCAPVALGSL